MKKINYLLIFLATAFQMSCQQNPFEDLEEGGWNNERSVNNIKFSNQVGKAVVTRLDDNTGTIDITINVGDIPDLSSIALQSLELSYDATSTLNIGDMVNFENATKSSTLTVTSPTGISREYTVRVAEFEETIIGTYDINNLVIYGGTGPEYGGGAVMAHSDKPWIWPEVGGPAAELDNVLTFEMEGITEEGNTFGTVTNDPGEDGLYADFTFIGDPQTDVNYFYRKIPEGESTWARNYTTGLVTFTFPDGSTASGSIEGSGTVDLGDGQSKTIEDQAFAFTLNGTDDWDKIYSDYDKFVKKPRRYWIEVTKR